MAGKVDLDQLKASFDLRDYVASALGAPAKHNYGYDSWNCPHPNHNDSSPSFSVWDDHFHCLAPDTPVLMANLTWKPLGDIQAGEQLVSFDEYAEKAKSRKTKIGTVLAVRRNFAPVAKVVTTQGEFIATQGHQWLVNHGTENSKWRTTSQLKPGTLIRQIIPYSDWKEDDLYRQGYVFGMTDGDGSFRYAPGVSYDDYSQFWRVALTDKDALERLHSIMHQWGIKCEIRSTPKSKISTKELWKLDIRNTHGLSVIDSKLRWSDHTSFYRGYLAAIFDAEGTTNAADIDIGCNQDLEIIQRIEKAAMCLGYKTTRRMVVSKNGFSNKPVYHVFLVGNRRIKIKYLADIRPAIQRKVRKIFGYTHNWTSESAEVLSVADAGIQEIVEIAVDVGTLTTMGLASHNCFGCGWHGSILDFIMEYDGCTLMEAAEKLGGNVPMERRPRQPKPAPAPKTPTIPMSTVEQHYSHIEMGIPFFNRRCISTPTSYKSYLGTHPNYKTYYKDKTGHLHVFTAKRYAVPNIFNGQVRAINYRRDDDALLDYFWYQHPNDKITIILQEIREKYGVFPDSQQILKAIGGGKYEQEKGSLWRPFNVGTLAEVVEGVIRPRPDLRYVLVHAETKEYDTLALHDHGYPCIGVTLNEDIRKSLPGMFTKVPMVYIIRDNDEPGREKAEELVRAIGKGRIIKPLDGHKDSGEVMQANLLDKWMFGSYGLEPVYR